MKNAYLTGASVKVTLPSPPVIPLILTSKDLLAESEPPTCSHKGKLHKTGVPALPGLKKNVPGGGGDIGKAQGQDIGSSFSSVKLFGLKSRAAVDRNDM